MSSNEPIKLSKKDREQLERLLKTCRELSAGKYDGPVEIVWDTDGKARLQLDPQAGRSTDEPPVC